MVLNNFMLLDISLDISEFLENVKEWLLSGIIEALQANCIKTYTTLFWQASDATGEAIMQLKVTPEEMFPGVYTRIIEIAETAFFPIAGIILMFVLCYECLSMVAENNRMKEFGPMDVYILIFKILIGVLLLAKSANIVNLFFKMGQWALIKAGISTIDVNMQVDTSFIEECTDILDMVGFWVLGRFVSVGVFIFSVMIKIAVWLRFVELYMFIVSASIPFSTFLNKELSQVGWNYVRKILSLAFQPIYMMICFTIFTGALEVQQGAGLSGTLLKAIAAMVILILALFKTRTISDSIFNAH